jgi:hypothetical protein
VRPKTIVYFEWVTFGTILLSALQQLTIAQGFFATIEEGATWYILILIFFLLVATLTLLVSRRRSKIAMWILIAWFAINVMNAIIVIESNIIVAEGLIRVLLGIGQVVALGLLFTPSARRWMSRKEEKNEKNEKLGEVFE